MKLVFIIGSNAVGKMTVGQALMNLTDLRLFHNHMMIEPVIEIFGQYTPSVITELRDVIFQSFAKSNCYGMIFTYMWAFDHQSDWDYIEHVKAIFKPYDTSFYYVELVANQKVRIERNATENRLENKKSKRDLDFSNNNLLRADQSYRLESFEGEIPFDHYIKIDNTDRTPADVAQQIKEAFNL
ncbi:MAG: hypothetical protein ACRCW2_15330 [Cellulosilyticaceae bacterium]